MLAFLARFNQLFGHVAGDFQGFGDRAALGNESGNIMGCGEVKAFGEFFDLEGRDLFHGCGDGLWSVTILPQSMTVIFEDVVSALSFNPELTGLEGLPNYFRFLSIPFTIFVE
jgi:hypothetical protein